MEADNVAYLAKLEEIKATEAEYRTTRKKAEDYYKGLRSGVVARGMKPVVYTGEKEEKRLAQCLETAKKSPLYLATVSLSDKCKNLKEELDGLAGAIIPIVTDTLELWRSSADYHTQTQPSHYARGELLPYEAWLKQLGFSPEIRRVSYGYELWVNGPKWQERPLCGRVPMKLRFTIYRQNGLNCRVYFPDLPWGVEDQYLEEPPQA